MADVDALNHKHHVLRNIGRVVANALQRLSGQENIEVFRAVAGPALRQMSLEQRYMELTRDAADYTTAGVTGADREMRAQS